MGDEAARETLELARLLERQGDERAAVGAYLRAGSVDEAARLLVSMRRLAEAARVLMDSLGVAPKDVHTLPLAARARAHRAAVLFAQAGDVSTSVALFVALGDRPKAADVLERAGDRAGAARLREGRTAAARAHAQVDAQRLEASGQLDAALRAYAEAGEHANVGRVAQRLGRFPEAARAYDAAGLFFDAALSRRAAGDFAGALASLLRVGKDHAEYRKAATEVIALLDGAAAHGQPDAFDFKVDQFLCHFLQSAPRGNLEEDAFYRAGRLFEQHDHREAALDVYTRLLERRPSYRDAQARRSHLNAHALQAHELPDLPPLPTPPAAPAPIAEPTPAAPSRGPPPATAHGLALTLRPDEGAPSPSALMSAQVAAHGHALGPGSVVAGRFHLDDVLGRGGMAVVYRATDLELGETVALKILSVVDADPESLRRFRQEVSVTRRLAHPNIVRVFDIGEHAGRRFLTMELVDGTSLSAAVSGRPLAIGRAVRYLAQACEGLGAAHLAGVVHRDVKPDNLLITRDDIVKVTDFGIAKHRATPGLTAQGIVAGTPAYISPEQISGFSAVTHRSDIYSLGVAAYEMLTGTLPFWHDELMPLLNMHLQQAPLSPRALNAAVPPALEALILAMLNKRPDDRPQSCSQIATWLVSEFIRTPA